MIEYQVIKPTNSILAPYIEVFMQLRLSGHCLKSKDLLPRPGVIWMFASAPLSVDEKQTADNLLIGIHQKPISISWQYDRASAFFVKFSPFGMSRFLDSPVSRLTNKTIDGARLFGRELEALHRNIVEMDDLSEKVKRMELFLIQRLNQPTVSEDMVRNLAEAIRHEKDCFCLRELKNKVPISNRQLERKFKELIGVNIQTYIRICRFDRARTSITEDIRLTDVGYDSGYFDQAHFSREFKRMASLQPRHFLENAPFYKFLSQLRAS